MGHSYSAVSCAVGDAADAVVEGKDGEEPCCADVVAADVEKKQNLQHCSH